MAKIILFANTDWYLFNFRLPLADALRKRGHEVVLISPAGEYGKRMEAEGFRWVAVPMNRRSLNPLREIAFIAWLARFMKNERADLIHGFTIKCAVYGALAGKMIGLPARINAIAGMGYVFTNSNLGVKLLRPLVAQLMRFSLNDKGSLLVLQNGDDVSLFVQSRLVDKERIRLIRGSGVSCTRFNPERTRQERTSTDKEGLNVVLAARLLWDKGVAEYIEAATLIKAKGLDVNFYLAGEPDDGNPSAVDNVQLKEWVRDGKVKWLGHVDDMPALLAKMDVMALPSYREGLPKTLIEAGACELALVTTDAAGCREVVTKDGVDGLIVPVGDGQALAEAIQRLFEDRVLCRRLGVAARAKVLAEFEESIVIRQTLAVYNELLSA